jgi:hypothetical protein
MRKIAFSSEVFQWWHRQRPCGGSGQRWTARWWWWASHHFSAEEIGSSLWVVVFDESLSVCQKSVLYSTCVVEVHFLLDRGAPRSGCRGSELSPDGDESNISYYFPLGDVEDSESTSKSRRFWKLIRTPSNASFLA